MGDIHIYFLPISIFLGSHIFGIKSQSCKLNQFLRVLTKEMKVVLNKCICQLYPQSLHFLQGILSVTPGKIYSFS